MQCSTSSIRKDSTIPYAENYLQPASGKSLRFREGTGYEDLDAICPAIMRANRVAVLKDCHLYFYRQHQGSYIHTFNLRRCDVLDVTRTPHRHDGKPLSPSGTCCTLKRTEREFQYAYAPRRQLHISGGACLIRQMLDKNKGACAANRCATPLSD